MDDLISRKALQLGLLNSTSFPSFYPFPNDRAVEKRMINFDYVMQIVKEQPTIEAEPVRHGRWERSVSMVRSAKCSECRMWITKHSVNEPDFRYCPHFGAKMDGDKHDTEE